MLEHIATLAYTQIHDHFQARKKELGMENFARLDSKCRLKGAKITLPEAACLLVLFQASGCPHFKRFLDWNRPRPLRLFPTLPAYSRLCKWVQKAEQLLLDRAFAGRAAPGPREALHAVDSTKVDPHKDKNMPKSLRKATGFGRTHEGFFVGLKLRLLADLEGRVAAFDLTQGNRHDLDPVKGGMLDGFKGRAWAGSGCVSAQVRQDLKAQGLDLRAKPTLQMEDERWIFDRIWAKDHRRRQVVEGVFGRLKSLFGLASRSVRSAASLRSRVRASLAACMWLPPASKWAEGAIS